MYHSAASDIRTEERLAEVVERTYIWNETSIMTVSSISSHTIPFLHTHIQQNRAEYREQRTMAVLRAFVLVGLCLASTSLAASDPCGVGNFNLSAFSKSSGEYMVQFSINHHPS